MAATDLASLLDSAVAEAKRAGHGVATAVHLLEALAGRDRARFEHEAGAGGLTALAARLRALPRTFKPVALAEELSALIEDCRRQPLPLEFLWQRVPALLGAPAPASQAGPPPSAADVPGVSEADAAAASAAEACEPAPLIFRPALPKMVELLLVRALQESCGNRLLERVFTGIQPAERLGAFARFLFGSAPVIVIESDLPYAESEIHEVLVAQPLASVPPQPLRPTVTLSGEVEYLQVGIPERGRSVVLVPLHAGQQMLELGRFCHEIASREVSALIGCERFALLPEPLRRVTDVRLHLPALDAETFAALFEALFSSPPPAPWDPANARWVRHVQHFDFEQPQRLGLEPAQALEFIRASVEDRLRSVEPVGGRRLEQLHGLGEAQQLARDLVAEIGEALAGRLQWSDLDRGMLLAGPPGTGKTTLARAIARDCGVRFIAASVTGWQAAGHLGDHIRAIRATFAEARRYAPSILFLDEIDSLGSREHLSGHNAQYQTEVINAVLEQMQGMDSNAPVFVIAATNLPERVDPALRRAGRLDRVVQIPYPASEALSAMYAERVQMQRARGAIGEIDFVLLGRLSLGLTGADVELIVRGAARRARRAQREMLTEDLIAEITHKPRDAGGIPRLGPSELERVALHEAGHALARYLSSTGGRDLGFVSIVPRSDGTLGFVALAPDERTLRTRRDYLEFIDVALAGRAAEEFRYGSDGISGGCSNDLIAATGTALQMITRFGLGPNGRLISVRDPRPEDLREAEQLLAAAYQSVLSRTREHRQALERLAGLLFERQELPAEKVLAALRD